MFRSFRDDFLRLYCKSTFLYGKGTSPGANYATNTAQDNDIESGNQLNQRSKQKIGN